MTKLELIGQIADLKEAHYKTTLLLSSLIELLEEKHMLSNTELSHKAQVIDLLNELEIKNATIKIK